MTHITFYYKRFIKAISGGKVKPEAYGTNGNQNISVAGYGFPSLLTSRNVIRELIAVGTGYNAGSFYMGLGIKFGKTVEHPMNLSTMPGVNGEKTYRGFFRSMFNFFRK